METVDASTLNLDMATLDFARDSEGMIYLSSTTTGVLRSEGMGQQFVDFNTGLNSMSVTSMTSSETGFVYVVSSDGIYFLDVNEDEFVKADGSFEGNYSTIVDIEAINNEENTPGLIGLTPMDYYETLAIASPNGLYYSDVTMNVEEEVVESVRELDAESVSVFPNPAATISGVQIVMNRNEDARVSMMDAAGNIVFDKGNVQLVSGFNSINFDGVPVLSDGNYYVNIAGQSGTTTVPVVIMK
jgi:hypothetical protein